MHSGNQSRTCSRDASQQPPPNARFWRRPAAGRPARRPVAPAAFLLAIVGSLLLIYPALEATAQSLPTFRISVVGDHTDITEGSSRTFIVTGKSLSATEICIEEPAVYAPGHSASVDFPDNCFDADNTTRTFTVLLNDDDEESLVGGELWVSLKNRPPCGGQDYLVASPASVHMTVYDNEPAEERLTRADR